jgi:hypothetical protein
LKLLSGFFGRGSLAIFRNVEFRVIEFEFDDGHTISISKLDSDVVKGAVPYSIEDKVDSDVVASWDGRHSEGKTAGGRMYEILDTYLPHITRVGPFEFQDRRTGEVLSYIDAVEQNLDNLPKEFGAQVARPDWLEQRRRSIHC